MSANKEEHDTSAFIMAESFVFVICMLGDSKVNSQKKNPKVITYTTYLGVSCYDPEIRM